MKIMHQFNIATKHKEIKQALIDNADENTILKSKRFFKQGENALRYGTPRKILTAVGSETHKEVKHWTKEAVYELCTNLWQSGYYEEAYVACLLVKYWRKKYEPKDVFVFQEWLSNYVNNWASCDMLCTTIIGYLLLEYPEQIQIAKKWTSSPNRWVRRGAAVSLVICAKKGLQLSEIFVVADYLLVDKDDMVQKGYGWMLKETTKFHKIEVFDYVMKNKKTMPRTALRYAIEKIPIPLKQEAMKKAE